jgi:hypothetical protein
MIGALGLLSAQKAWQERNAYDSSNNTQTCTDFDGTAQKARRERTSTWCNGMVHDACLLSQTPPSRLISYRSSTGRCTTFLPIEVNLSSRSSRRLAINRRISAWCNGAVHDACSLSQMPPRPDLHPTEVQQGGAQHFFPSLPVIPVLPTCSSISEYQLGVTGRCTTLALYPRRPRPDFSSKFSLVQRGGVQHLLFTPDAYVLRAVGQC